MKQKQKKISLIVALVSAVIVAAGGVLLTRSIVWLGWTFFGLSLALLVFFIVSLKKNFDSLIKLTLFIYVFGVLLIGVMLPLSYTGALDYFVNLNVVELQEIVGNSKYSEIIFIVLQFLQVTFLPLPSTITTMVGAALFRWDSIIYTLI
ncbi:MAG: hypothetical protein LBT20_05920, partial [Clostridiales bacterium]|nr:hypothetical protein [Clostridiales bacterium]